MSDPVAVFVLMGSIVLFIVVTVLPTKEEE
jgi:hypothetical protein